VLTDVQMADTDAATLVRAIKEDPAIAGAAIVMLASAGEPGDAAQCRELGVAAHVPKPITRSELAGAILSSARDRTDTRRESPCGSTSPSVDTRSLTSVSSTTPFDMTVLKDPDRFHRVMDAICEILSRTFAGMGSP
jgi:DNA-binding NarL/FixJ family response regulator